MDAAIYAPAALAGKLVWERTVPGDRSPPSGRVGR